MSRTEKQRSYMKEFLQNVNFKVGFIFLNFFIEVCMLFKCNKAQLISRRIIYQGPCDTIYVLR